LFQPKSTLSKAAEKSGPSRGLERSRVLTGKTVDQPEIVITMLMLTMVE
jgi:hypothetical protein